MTEIEKKRKKRNRFTIVASAGGGVYKLSLQLVGMSEIQARKSLHVPSCISRDTCLRELNVIIKPNHFCYDVQNEEF